MFFYCCKINIVLNYKFYFIDLQVIEALRKIPTIWQVLIIGSFTLEFHKSIITLVNKNSVGNPFLPVKGCIVDLSPTLKDKFEIMILFERKSVIKQTMYGLRSIKKNNSIDRETEFQKLVFCNKNLVADNFNHNLNKSNSSQPSNKINIDNNYSSKSFDKDNELRIKSEDFDLNVDNKINEFLNFNELSSKIKNEPFEFDVNLDIKIKTEKHENQFAKVNIKNEIESNNKRSDIENIKILNRPIKDEFLKKENYEYCVKNEKELKFVNDKQLKCEDNYEKKRKYLSSLSTDLDENPSKKLSFSKKYD